MEKPFPAYEGNDPYVFVCYAHDDSAVVYPAWKEVAPASTGFSFLPLSAALFAEPVEKIDDFVDCRENLIISHRTCSPN